MVEETELNPVETQDHAHVDPQSIRRGAGQEKRTNWP